MADCKCNPSKTLSWRKASSFSCPENQAEEKKRLETEIAKLKAEQELLKFQQEDREAQIAARDWAPEFEICKAKAGSYVSFKINDKEYEFVSDYTEGINVASVGTEPSMQYFPEMNYGCVSYTGAGTYFVLPANPAIIEISSFGGKKTVISVSRHSLDVLLAGLRKVWRENR